MQISVAGLGLIGGSLAKALKKHTTHTVTGYDLDGVTVKKALEEGTIDLQDGFSSADYIFIALYPKAAVEFVKTNCSSFKKGAVIVDMCGVKRYVSDGIGAYTKTAGVHYIGGHPMAGRELFGYDNSSADLFDGASMILTPSLNIPPEILADTEKLFLSMGFGGITLTTPQRHDEVIALTSQLAHIVSSAYVQNPAADSFTGFSAGSFRDMTRVAKLHEGMWTELFLLNSDYLTVQLDSLIEKLADFKDGLMTGDEEKIYGLLKTGRLVKERLLEKDKGR